MKMMIVMDMTTGKRETKRATASSVDEFGAYHDEVLNTGWLPLIELQVEAMTAGEPTPCAHLEPEEFLRNLYHSQE